MTKQGKLYYSSGFKLLADLKTANYSRRQYLDRIMDTHVLTRLRLDMHCLESCQGRRKGMVPGLRIFTFDMHCLESRQGRRKGMAPGLRIFRSACKCRSIVFAFLIRSAGKCRSIAFAFLILFFFFFLFFSCSGHRSVNTISQDRVFGERSNFAVW